MSLSMQVERLPDGRWQISAPWLTGVVTGDTWEEAYWEAVKVR